MTTVFKVVRVVSSSPLVLILVPARELALQTARIVKQFGENLKINSMCCFGGQSLEEDLFRLQKGIHVIV